MTPQEIREEVQRIVAPHNNAVQLVPRDIDRVAHETLCEMALHARPPSLRKESTISIVAGTASYLLPSDFFLPLRIRVLDGTSYADIEKKTREEIDLFDTTTAGSAPLYYYENGIETTIGADYGKRRITLWPTPTQSVTDGILCRYLRRPTAFSVIEGYEIIDIDAAHHFGIVYRTAWKILMRQGNKVSKVTDAYEGLYNSALSNLKTFHSEEWLSDYEPTIRAWRGAGLDDPFRRA